MQADSTAKSLKLHGRSVVLHVPSARPIPKWVQRTFLLFVASIPLETLPVENVTSAYLTLTKLFGFLFFACYLFHSGLPFKLSLPRIPTAMWWFLAYLTVYALTGLAIKDEGIRNYVMRLLKLVQLLALFWLASELLRDPNFAKKSLLTLAIACVGLAVGTLLRVPGFSPEGGGARTTAFNFSANTLGVLMAYSAIIIIGFCLKEAGWSAKRKLFLFALTLPLFLVLVSTGSRAGIGAFVIGMSFFFIPHRGSRRQVLAFGLTLATLIGVVYLVAMDPIASERWNRTIQEGETARRGDIYAAALDMIAEKPIFGWGGRDAVDQLALRLGVLTKHIDAHNLILYLLIEVGFIGTIPFMIAICLCVRDAWKGRADRFGLLPLAIIMTMLAYSMTHTGLIMKVFWLFLGFAVAASSVNRELRYRWVVSSTDKGAAGPAWKHSGPRASVSFNK
jgi:O-antigen ligase